MMRPQREYDTDFSLFFVYCSRRLLLVTVRLPPELQHRSLPTRLVSQGNRLLCPRTRRLCLANRAVLLRTRPVLVVR